MPTTNQLVRGYKVPKTKKSKKSSFKNQLELVK